MKNWLILAIAVALAAACAPSDFIRKNPIDLPDTSGGNGGSCGSGGSGDNGSSEGGSGTQTPGARLSDAFKGWRCVTTYMNIKNFDQTITFHYDELGRIDEYTENQKAYENDGVTAWSDEDYKRIYHYTSPTHIDYYNDFIEGHKPATWYNFDDKGRITEAYNSYGDNYLFSYNAAGQLIEVKNFYQYSEQEDEVKYDSWKKSRIFEWLDGRPVFYYQRWTSPDGKQEVTRDMTRIRYDMAYRNPFRGMVVDPLTLGLETGIFSFLGWTGLKSEFLITGWYDEDDPDFRTDVTLLTDREDHITGMTVEEYNHGLDSRREYTFYWNGDAPILKKDGIPVIN